MILMMIFNDFSDNFILFSSNLNDDLKGLKIIFFEWWKVSVIEK